MLVGNIATLRPLFQRMLNLGSSGSEQPYSDELPRGISNGNRSHPYQSFDPELELGTVIDPKDEQMPAVRIRGGRSSVSSDCESQKQILEKGDEALPMPRNKDGIVVSQHVEVTRE